MGKVGKEIIEGNVQSIIDDLKRAAAAELHDAYRYKVLAKIAEGHHATELAEWFEKTSADEWNHLGIWMERIVSLGGMPFVRPSQAEALTYAKYLDPPGEPTDLRKMVEDSLEGERAAIRFYMELYKETVNTDPVTAALAQDALADEVSDEDDLERFLTAIHGAEEHKEGRMMQPAQAYHSA